MASLDVGTLFSSYEELKARIDEYQSQNSINLIIRGSTSIEATKKKLPTRNLNEALKYSELYYTCSECTKYKSWNKSVNNVQMDCVNIRLVATKDGQHLEIRKVNEKHNHPISKSPRKKNIVKVQHDFSRGRGENVPRSREVPSPNLKRKRNNPLADSINLGKQTERWRSFKEHLNVYSDEEFAEVLLNRLEQEFKIQTSVPSLILGRQSSTMSTSTPIDIKMADTKEGTVQDNDHASEQQEREYFSDLPVPENYKYNPVSDQQRKEYFSENNDENQKYRHIPVSPTLPQSEMKPQVITYLSEQEESSPFQMPEREIKPLHECSNDIYQDNGNGERSGITLPIIDLGKQYERWKHLKQKLHIDTDEGMAMFLIDHQ